MCPLFIEIEQSSTGNHREQAPRRLQREKNPLEREPRTELNSGWAAICRDQLGVEGLSLLQPLHILALQSYLKINTCKKLYIVSNIEPQTVSGRFFM